MCKRLRMGTPLLRPLILLLLTIRPVSVEGLPLEPERTIEFETGEVTWLSLDVSPDGKTLVIEALGDLYLLPSEGGSAKPLTAGTMFDFQPAWSPDGKRIAFISDRSGNEELWIIGTDGKGAKKLSHGSDMSAFASPTWSPDSQHVVVSQTTSSQRTFELWAYHIDGGKGVQITERGDDSSHPNRSNALGASYSPDGQYLYYAHKRGGFEYNAYLPLWQIVRRELRTGTEDYVTASAGSAFRPELSPNGGSLVYGTRFDAKTGLRIRNFQTGVDEWLVYPVQRDEQESAFTRDLLPNYTFAPDGESVYFTKDGKIQTVNISSKRVSNVPFTLRVEQAIGPRLYFPYRLGIGPVGARLIRDVEMSPNGEQLAFTALARVYVYDIQSQKITAISDRNTFAAQPTWTPDGKQVTYVTWTNYGGHIWSSRANGRGKAIRLTRHKAFYSEPVWSKDGKQIYALRAIGFERQHRADDWGDVTGTDLVAISKSNRDARLVRPARGLHSPHWGPEHDRIYLYGASGLVSFKRDGTDLIHHFVLKGPGIYYADDPVPATSMRISPDGKHAIAIQADQLYVTSLLGTSQSGVETTVSNSTLPLVKLTNVGADDLGWSPDGSLIHWTAGKTVHIRPLASITSSNTQGDEPNDTVQDEMGDCDCEEGYRNYENDVNSIEDDDAPTEQPEDHESVEKIVIKIYEPRYVHPGSVALTGGTIITMVSDKPEVISSLAVLIENGRIKSLTARDALPSNIETIDVSGLYILPGYVDTHAHFPVLRSVTGAPNWSFLANLAYGVTTAIDVQTGTVDLLEYEDLIDAGFVLGPRTLSTGPGIFSDNRFKSKKEALAVLKRYKEHYDLRNLKSYIVGSRKQRQWLLQASKELNLMPTSEGALDMKLGLTHVIDGYAGHEHNFPVLDLYRDVIELVARSQIAYTPTLLVTYGGPYGENFFFSRESPRHDGKLQRFIPPQVLQSLTTRRQWFHEDVHIFQRVAAQAHKIVRKGGMVGVGAHGQLHGLGYHWELWALHSGGFSNYEALRAATSIGAQMIGVASDVGSIEVGKLADMVVLNANPLDDIRASDDLVYIIKSGVIYNANTLDEVWPNDTPLPPMYWHEDRPAAINEPVTY